MTKTDDKLTREIQEIIGLPPAVLKKWRTKVTAYKKRVREMEAGYSDAALMAMAKARDALDDMIYEATAYVPYVAGQKAHLAPPIVELQDERDKLVKSTWEAAKETGRAANERAHKAARSKLDDEIREANRPFDWMRR